MGNGESRLAYTPALDGLRALAVLAVVAYHAGIRETPGGFLGVDVFLVLSGYLITALLLGEWRAHGGISLRRFWDRRARRLIPALALVVGVVVVQAAATGATASVRGDAVASLTWVQNWYLGLSDASYFAVFGEASPLRHTWSLALEAQWYLVWPVVLAGLLRLSRGRTLPVAGVALILAAASALLMAAWFDTTADPSRIYYGTDTRGHVLLVGAALALVLHRSPGTVRPSRLWVPAGIIGAAVATIAVLRLADLDPRLYRGGFAVVGLATAAVIAAALRPGSAVGRILAVPPLPALGRISYGVYLWHWPLFVWLDPSPATTALAIVLAAVSYRVLELPVRRVRAPLRAPVLTFTLAGAAAVAVVALALPLPPVADAPSAAAAVASAVPPVEAAAPAAPTIAPSPIPEASVSRVLVAGDSVAFTLAQPFQAEWADGRFSVDGGASSLGCGVVAGRPFNDGLPTYWADPACLTWEDRWRERLAEVRPDVAIALVGAWEVLDREVEGAMLKVGSEDSARYLRGQIDRAIEVLSASGARVILLTAPCYRPAEDAPGRSTSDRADDARVEWFNELLRQRAVAHDGVAVADLHGVVCPGGDYLATRNGVALRTDGVHFTADGARLVWGWLGPQLTTR